MYIPEPIKPTKLMFSAILLSFGRVWAGISFCKNFQQTFLGQFQDLNP